MNLCITTLLCIVSNTASTMTDRQWGHHFDNMRVNKWYGTSRIGNELTTPGSQFMINPDDSFDALPSEEDSYFSFWKSYFEENNENNVEHWETVEGADAPLVFAKKITASITTEMYTVPTPTANLPRNILQVESAEQLPIAETITLCYKLEDKKFACCVPTPVPEIYEVYVSQVGDSSVSETLWVACHVLPMDGSFPLCHVMNTGDIIVTAESDTKTNLWKEVLEGRTW